MNTLVKCPEKDIEIESSCDSFVAEEDSFYLFPSEYSIVLCVDNCETFSG